MKVNCYALYKGDELLSVGSVKEIAEEMNILQSSVRFLGNKTYLKRTEGNKNRRILVKLEDEKE